MFSKFRRLPWLCFAIILLSLSLSLPLWADEILMSRAGFANWLLQAVQPAEMKIQSAQTKADNLEASIKDLENQIIHTILLIPGNQQAQLTGPGKSQTQTLDVAPLIQNGRTMVPLRFIGEALGAAIQWNNDTRQVMYQSNNRSITLNVDSKQAKLDGQAIQLETAPVVIQGRTLVPLRYVSEWMGAVVRWDGTARTVLIRYYKGAG